MKNTRELQLRRLALVLTAALVLQAVWSGASLWLLSEPEPIFPAESSLRVDGVSLGSDPGDQSNSALVSRPLFWKGRQAHVAVEDAGQEVAPERGGGSKAIDKVKLLGVYSGETAGIIVFYEGQRRRLRLNDSIEDWTFAALLREGAIFESGSDTRALHLEHAVPAGKGKGNTINRADNGDAPDPAANEANNNEKSGE